MTTTSTDHYYFNFPIHVTSTTMTGNYAIHQNWLCPSIRALHVFLQPHSVHIHCHQFQLDSNSTLSLLTSWLVILLVTFCLVSATVEFLYKICWVPIFQCIQLITPPPPPPPSSSVNCKNTVHYVCFPEVSHTNTHKMTWITCNPLTIISFC